MIAISVFSVGILVVLQMIIKNLTVVDTVKLRSSATILAKEWVELAFNIRDANLDKWLNWDCLLDNEIYHTRQNDLTSDQNICEDTLDGTLQLSFSPDQYIYSKRIELSDNFTEAFENNTLYSSSGVFYSNNQDALEETYWHSEESFYARYLVFKQLVENERILPSDKLLKIESHVLIRKWWYTGEVILESLIWNY